MKKQIEKLIAVIKADYASCKFSNDENVKQKMIEDFDNCLGFNVGKKYIKIMTGNGGTPMSSVWGFVVNVDDDRKFKKGDILYPAGWATPARNKARGNIVEGNFDWVQWTGPAYLQQHWN